MAHSTRLQSKHWSALLATLSVIVLIAHLAIITSAKGQFSISKPVQTTAFSTRMVELPMPTPVIEKLPELVAPPKMLKTKPAAAVLPKAAPIAAPIAAPAQQATTVETTVATVAPTATATSTATSVTPTVAEVAIPSPEPTSATTTAITTATSSELVVPPPAFTAMNSGLHRYKVIFTKNGSANQGKALVKWQQNGEKYALGLTASMLFIDILTWGSTGFMSPTGLQPERFSDKRYRKSEVAAHFDRVQGKIIFSANAPQAVLQEGAQDRISVIWQIAGMLAADPKNYPPGNTFSLQTVSATNAEPWLFTVNEPETLNLETGSQTALRLTRNPRREFDQKIELWFVPAMNYLPARFRFTETNGDYVDAVWQSVEDVPNALPR